MSLHKNPVTQGPSRGLLTAIMITASILISPAARSAEPPNYRIELTDLAKQSDAVLIGSIEKQNIDVSRTVVDVRVDTAYQGAPRAGDVIRLVLNSGRVMISKDDPDLTGVSKAVFFVSQKPNSTPAEYGFVQGPYGLKPLIHDSVYTNPQNPIDSVKLKKYREALTALKTAKNEAKGPAA